MLFYIGLSLLAVLLVAIHVHIFLLGFTMAMLCRLIMTSAIYQKVLSLSQATLAHISSGHVVNLASNDVQRLDFVRYCCLLSYPPPPLLVSSGIATADIME